MNRYDHLFFGGRPLRVQIDPDEDITMAFYLICIGLFVLLAGGGAFWLALRTIFKLLDRTIASS